MYGDSAAWFSNIAQLCRNKWSCSDYAEQILGIHLINGRAMSPTPGNHKSYTAFMCDNDSWHDWSANIGGDIIDLCAYFRHNGDKVEAAKELLGSDFPSSESNRNYKKAAENLEQYISRCHKALRPEDREYLHSRRISDQTIERLKIGFDNTQGKYSLHKYRLVIPYFKNGHVVYCISRSRNIPEGRPDDKYIKSKLDGYNEHVIWGLHTLIPQGQDSRPNMPAEFHTHSGTLNAKDWIIIAEGAFDAMSFEQDGWQVLSAITGHFSQSQKKTLFKILHEHSARGGNVFILFDSDKAGNAFQRKMAKELFAEHIPFMCGELPKSIPVDGISIQIEKDVSDYYTAGGNLAELVANSHMGLNYLAQSLQTRDEVKEFIKNSSRHVDKCDILEFADHIPTDVMSKKQVAVAVREFTGHVRDSDIAQEIADDGNLIYNDSDSFYTYANGVWSRISDDAVNSIIDKKMGRLSTGPKLDSIRKILKARIRAKINFNSRNIITFLNGVYDFDHDKFVDHSPSFFSTVQLNFCYDPDAKPIKWRKFIQEICSNDLRKAHELQKAAGYIFCPDCRFQKGFMLLGEGANGKSVFIETLQKTIGEENCTNIDPSDFGERFEIPDLEHSLANFSTETKSDLRKAQSAFNQIICGESVRGARKFKDSRKISTRAKLFFNCNRYITANDFSYALARRFVFFSFNETFTGKKANINLARELEAELPAIFNWMLEGYRDLIQDNGFDNDTPDQQNMMQEFIENINPAAFFVEEKLKTVEDATYTAKNLWSDYTRFCELYNFKKLSFKQFSQALSSAIRMKLPDVKIDRSNRNCIQYIFPSAQMKEYYAFERSLQSA